MLGNEPSLVEVVSAPFFERYVASALYWKGMRVRDPAGPFQAIDEWMAALEANVQSYRALMGDTYSHAHDIPPQYGSASFDRKNAEQIQARVDGWAGNEWSLPLEPLDINSLEPYAGHLRAARDDGLGMAHRLEACERLFKNHEKLVPFMLRSIGHRPRTVTAPLSDPDARCNEADLAALREPLDAVLARVAMWLLDPSFSPSNAQLPAAAAGCNATDRTRLVRCLAYLRDRIGVPRDLYYPAARLVRAHLNCMCRVLVGDDAWNQLSAELRPPRA